MTSDAQPQSQTGVSDGTLLGIDLSSWVSWASYYAGFKIAVSQGAAPTVMKMGWEVGVLAGAIVAFFVSITFIQRHMKFSLLANSYGTPHHLVTDGVFASSRNPIYVAFFMPLLSLAVLSQWGALAACGFYLFGMNQIVIRREERELEAGFGDEYKAYKARARRWL